ncbi:MAG: ferrochelatase [Chlamydiae bacterium]|nr:ferrochelatase [Chlamydiota bacterium]
MEKLEKESADEWYIFPIFPQFSYATSGLIAQFFSKTLDQSLVNKFFWTKSYGSHNSFVSLQQKLISDLLKKNNLQERDIFLIFAAHGIPNHFLQNGDFYESECQTSAKAILKAFPYALGKLGFYNFYFEKDNNNLLDICKNIKTFAKDRKNALLVPISSCLEFSKTTSEIEDNLCKVLKSQGINSFKTSSLGLNLDWVRSILNIIEEKNCVSNHMLTNAPAGLLNVD